MMWSCKNSTPHRDWDMGTFNFNHSGWWGWHLIAIFAIFFLGYSMSKRKMNYME